MVKVASDIPEQVLNLFGTLRWSELSADDIEAIARVLELFVENSLGDRIVYDTLVVDSAINIPGRVVEVLNKVDWQNVNVGFFNLVVLQKFFEMIGLRG